MKDVKVTICGITHALCFIDGDNACYNCSLIKLCYGKDVHICELLSGDWGERRIFRELDQRGNIK